MTKFVINNKMHLATKVSLFMINYNRELKIEADIRKKEKVEKAMNFAEKMKKVQKEVRTVLKKV